ncbi:hypothetical protein ACLB2K_023025 [Fragaria x ananassa]
MAEFRLFKPLVPGQVSIYVCGVTAYALSHIGHARAAVNFDVLYRYLEELGYKVTYCRTPTHEPRVSDHMEQIIDMITQIINNDYAYVVDGDVFFAVEKFPNYGQLSKQKLEHIRAGARVCIDSRKRNPADFALWKSAKPGEPSWVSLGGEEGRGGTLSAVP